LETLFPSLGKNGEEALTLLGFDGKRYCQLPDQQFIGPLLENSTFCCT